MVLALASLSQRKPRPDRLGINFGAQNGSHFAVNIAFKPVRVGSEEVPKIGPEHEPKSSCFGLIWDPHFDDQIQIKGAQDDPGGDRPVSGVASGVSGVASWVLRSAKLETILICS